MLKKILASLLLLFAAGFINSAIATAAVIDEASAPFAADKYSIGYQTLVWISGELRDVVFKIYDGFSTIISPLLYLLTALTILGVIIGYIINKPPHLMTILSIFVLIILLRQLGMDSSKFDYWIYHPIEKIMFGLPAIIIETVFAGKFAALSSNPLENMFMQMDTTIGLIANVSEKVMEASDISSHAGIWIKALFLQITFFILQIAFSYVFILSIWSIHMLLAAVPIALCFAIHPKTRKYIYNIINYASAFMLTPAMATIAMTMTITMLRGITDTARILAKETANLDDFPENFFWHAMFLGIISIFFHLKANSFAGKIIGLTDNGFGKLLGSGNSLASIAKNEAANFTKSTIMPGKVIYPNAAGSN